MTEEDEDQGLPMDDGRPTATIKEQGHASGRLTWIVIGVLWVVGFALGFYGLAQYARSIGQTLSILDLIYRLLQLVTLESGAVTPPIPWTLELARFGLPALAAWTVLRAVMHLFREQARRIASLFWRNHLIVAGLSRKGFQLATELAAAGRKVVVIERDPSHPLIHACRQQGIVVLDGDATDPSGLGRAQIRRAGSLIAVTGDDTTNTEVAITANELIRHLARPPLHCIVHIINPGMWNLLRRWEVAQGKFEALRLELFNIYQRGADFLIDEYNLANEPAEDDESPPNVLIVGLGTLSEHVVVQAARGWFHARNKPDKIGVVVVDPIAVEKLDLLVARYPALRESAELIPAPIEAASAAFEKGEYVTDRAYQLAIVDLPNDEQSLATALTLKTLLTGNSTSVAIHMSHSGGILRLMETLAFSGSDEPQLHPFTLVERVCDRHFMDQGTHERLAQALHLAYLENRQQNSTWDEDDPVLVHWEKLPHSVQNSNRAQADFIGEVLRKNGFELALLNDWSQPPHQFNDLVVEELAGSEHDRWKNERLKQGWRYAPGPKDEAKRIHPDLIAWNDLPEGEKEKNRVFIRSWPLILHRAGFQIVPMQTD